MSRLNGFLCLCRLQVSEGSSEHDNPDKSGDNEDYNNLERHVILSYPTSTAFYIKCWSAVET